MHILTNGVDSIGNVQSSECKILKTIKNTTIESGIMKRRAIGDRDGRASIS